MTFRDDHDAAIARGDALARELDQAKETADKAETTLAAERAERARLEAEVAELRAKPPVHTVKVEPNPNESGRADKPAGSAALLPVAGLGLVILGIAIAVLASSDEPKTPAARAVEPRSRCTLTSEPPGAEVYGMIGFSRQDAKYLGVTPLTKDRDAWIMESNLTANRFELRLKGYEPLLVDAPLRSLACSDSTFALRQ